MLDKKSVTGVRTCATLLAVVLAVSLCARAQQTANALPDAPLPQSEDLSAPTIRNFPRNVLHDQAAIWTSPIHIRAHDLIWLAPLGAAAGVAIATDTDAMRNVVSHDKSFNNANTRSSNILTAGMIGAPVVLYGYGLAADDDHPRETGLLGAEAMGDSVVVEQAMKLIFWRERPTANNARGHFFQTNVGLDSSFPSSHSVVAWSAASVIAAEYPHPIPVFLSYAGATAISLNRVLGQQHFPSDVLVGSAAGWLVGRMVYRRHHRWAEHKGWVPVPPNPLNQMDTPKPQK
ncbi:MAG TPA: phosphatase PAP2 family protein [Terracidiphilus sp.]